MNHFYTSKEKELNYDTVIACFTQIAKNHFQQSLLYHRAF